jgi:hypothetical protein
LKIAGNEIKEEDNAITLYLGYVPKDISFNLSVLLDNPQIFTNKVTEYSLGDKNNSKITIEVNLKSNILRDHRRRSTNHESESYSLPYIPGMQKYVKSALYAI